MKEIIKMSKEVLTNPEKIDEIVDDHFDGLKDFADTASEIIKPVKTVISIYNYAKKRKFKAFLKAYARRLKTSNGLGQNLEDFETLKEYLENDKNLNFIYETIDGAINSKSIHCSAILGHYASYILAAEIEITYREIITVEALRSLNDIDLEMFTRTFKAINLAKKGYHRIRDYDDLVLYQTLCETVIHKLKGLNILQEGTSGQHGSVSGWGIFYTTEMSEEIFQIIIDLGIDEELIKKY